jgi:hypothetical protein
MSQHDIINNFVKKANLVGLFKRPNGKSRTAANDNDQPGGLSGVGFLLGTAEGFLIGALFN